MASQTLLLRRKTASIVEIRSPPRNIHCSVAAVKYHHSHQRNGVAVNLPHMSHSKSLQATMGATLAINTIAHSPRNRQTNQTLPIASSVYAPRNRQIDQTPLITSSADSPCNISNNIRRLLSTTRDIHPPRNRSASQTVPLQAPSRTDTPIRRFPLPAIGNRCNRSTKQTLSITRGRLLIAQSDGRQHAQRQLDRLSMDARVVRRAHRPNVC